MQCDLKVSLIMGHYGNWIQNEGDFVVVVQSLRQLYVLAK